MPKKPSVPVSSTGPARPVAGAREVPATAPLTAAEKAAAAAPVARAQAVAAVAPAAAAAPVTEAARVDAPGAARLQEIADRLRRGELTPAQAVDALIDDAVRGQSAAPDQALGATLRAALQAHVESDPQLSARVRRLGRARPPRKERS